MRQQHSMNICRVNKGMNLEDFKFIYWMEYAHRMWGRALGFVFAVPFSYFVAKGYVTTYAPTWPQALCSFCTWWCARINWLVDGEKRSWGTNTIPLFYIRMLLGNSLFFFLILGTSIWVCWTKGQSIQAGSSSDLCVCYILWYIVDCSVSSDARTSSWSDELGKRRSKFQKACNSCQCRCGHYCHIWSICCRKWCSMWTLPFFCCFKNYA